jgi:hypothetical protein
MASEDWAHHHARTVESLCVNTHERQMPCDSFALYVRRRTESEASKHHYQLQYANSLRAH